MDGKQISTLLLCTFSYLGLTGFLFPDAQQDVAQYMRQVQEQKKASHKVELPSIPELPPYQPFVYQAGDADPYALKPFVLDVASSDDEQGECDSADCGDGPPAPHAPFFLENYELDELTMVGTMMSPNNQRVVLIQTPDSGIVKTKVGEYIGRNNGLIQTIDLDHVVVREKRKVPRGWQNQMAIMELFN